MGSFPLGLPKILRRMCAENLRHVCSFWFLCRVNEGPMPPCDPRAYCCQGPSPLHPSSNLGSSLKGRKLDDNHNENGPHLAPDAFDNSRNYSGHYIGTTVNIMDSRATFRADMALQGLWCRVVFVRCHVTDEKPFQVEKIDG